MAEILSAWGGRALLGAGGVMAENDGKRNENGDRLYKIRDLRAE